MYVTDEQISKRMKFLAIVCLGGMQEGYDYSAERAKLAQLAEKRREFRYRGGYLSESDAARLMGKPTGTIHRADGCGSNQASERR